MARIEITAVSVAAATRTHRAFLRRADAATWRPDCHDHLVSLLQVESY